MNYNMLIQHIQNLRSSLSGKPSSQTLAAWRLEDTRHGMMADYQAEQEDGEDDFAFAFTSEVKRK